MSESLKWYYADQEQTLGPITPPEVENLIDSGVISPATWIVAEGGEDWVLAKDSIFFDKSISASSEETPLTDPECVAVEPQYAGGGRMSGGFGTVCVTAKMFSAQLTRSLPIVRRRWLGLVPGLFLLGGAVLLLHQFRHWHSFRRARSSSNVEHVPEPILAPVQISSASTPGPPLDPSILKTQFESITDNEDQRRILAEWEQSMARTPQTGDLNQAKRWMNYCNALSYYESMHLPSGFVIVQQIADRTYEARFTADFSPPDSFVLLTIATRFQSEGRAGLPIKYIETRNVKLNNGFARETLVFREVPQDPPEKAESELESAALSFSNAIRAAPPDDTTLESYIAEIHTYMEKRDRREQAEPEWQMFAWPDQFNAMGIERNVLYVCLQTRLRTDIQPINLSEVASVTAQPSASASPTPLSSRRHPGSRRENAAPSASLSPSVALTTPGSVDGTRPSSLPSPSARLAKPGTYFLLQYASVKTDRGVYGFEPGHEVHLVRSLPDKGTLVVSDGKCELEIAGSQLTNDLDVAANLAGADAAIQAQIVSRLQSDKSAAESRQHELDVARSRDVEAAEKQRMQNSRSRATPNPLDP